ncbi:MAG: HIT domain-containing protein [Gemmatimonadaceae bacterium]
MTVYSDDVLQALVSRAPINRYHVIIVPRDHVERLTDLSSGIAAAVVSTAQRVSRAIVAAAAPDGITYMTEDDLTGQGYNLVAHWKLHLIPRFSYEAVRIDWARTADPGPHERGRIADDIRRHLSPAAT